MQQIPNLISASRLLGAVFLLWLLHSDQQPLFAILLPILVLTDFVDGWLARKFNWASQTGATLDSIADITLVIVALLAIWQWHQYIFVQHGWVLWTVVSVWVIVHGAALTRYRKLASFHTLVARIGIVAFWVFAISLFLLGFEKWIYYATGVICFTGGLENLIMVMWLADWRPDIRHGLLTLIRERRVARS